MVMWFNVEKARKFLLENGFVFTLRPKAPRLKNKWLGYDVLSYNGFGKKGKVFFCWLSNPDIVEPFVKWSGFETAGEWREEAKGNTALYLVVLVNCNA